MHMPKRRSRWGNEAWTMTALDEAKWEEPVAQFLKAYNDRVSPKVEVATTWVRVKPATPCDLEAMSTPESVPLIWVGSLVTVAEVDGDDVVIQAGGQLARWSLAGFTQTFVRAVRFDGDVFRYQRALKNLVFQRKKAGGALPDEVEYDLVCELQSYWDALSWEQREDVETWAKQVWPNEDLSNPT